MGEIAFGPTGQGLRQMPENSLQKMRIVSIRSDGIARRKTVFIPLFQSQRLSDLPLIAQFLAQTRRLLLAFAQNQFKGEDGETKSLWLSSSGSSPERIVLFGLGEKTKWHERKEPLVARRMVRHAKAEKIDEFAIALIGSARLFSQNALMAEFEYTKYKERPKSGWPEVKTVFLGVEPRLIAETKKEIEQGVTMGQEVNACRELANTPGSDMTPAKLAAAAIAVGKRTGVKVKILDEPQIKKLGMGGVIGVARGSDEKPKFIILEYMKGLRGQKPLVLAGKGVTFDTGGINLKPEPYMSDMHMDMSGGAAVIHGMAAIARLRQPINVVGLIPAVENMPSGSSYRPGDLLKSLSGKTIEVLNTDAEGRVILADALTYALRYNPALIADFATLTGAAHVALGNYCSALFTNRERLMDPLGKIGRESGDYVWPLPLWDEYLAEIKGTFGDIANIAKQDRYGGAIHGAKFLEQFVNDTPWAHIDIAPRMTAVDSDYLAKGATGVGVRYIVELAKAYPQLNLA